jgi:hypothetical protein
MGNPVFGSDLNPPLDAVIIYDYFEMGIKNHQG